MLIVTVSQINRYVKAILEEDKKLNSIFIQGEISNFTRHYRSGHCYFTLKDRESSVRAVMFRSDADQLLFDPENGMSVIVHARVAVYERDGAYQLYVNDMQPDGAGALAVAFEQSRARLAAEGLFDERYKKPLPRFPKRIGIVTSETGAALQDVISVLTRRYPLCTAVVAPAQVQGKEAAATIVTALKLLDSKGKCDVIIVGRGGGSAEDLWCFNEEILARAVFQCRTPVISAVGHETDYTICDFVADVRAPTPSAAAELATLSVEDLERELKMASYRLQTGMQQALSMRRETLDRISMRPGLQHPKRRIESLKERMDFLEKGLYNKKCIFIQRKRQRLATSAALLESLSPLRVLQRGYTVTFCDDKMVRSAKELFPGDRITVRLRDGMATAAVETVTEEKPDEEKHDL